MSRATQVNPIRLGMLTPSSNTVLEPVTTAMVSGLPDVSVHFSRFRVTEIALSADSLAQFDDSTILAAAELLAHAKVDAIALRGTSSGWLGFARDRQLVERIRLDRILVATTAVLALTALAAPFVDSRVIPLIGNLGLLVTAVIVFVAGLLLSWRGDRPARILLLSWTPLIVFSMLRTIELMGVWTSGPDWLAHALSGSFSLAGLLLTFGLADKLLELRRDRDRASERASMDALTGALSRAAIEQRVREAIAAAHADGSALSVAFVDIDHFKAVNDTYGHAAGDRLLKEASAAWHGALRAVDLLARYGGEEFVVLLPDADEAEARQIVERALAATPQGQTFSAGIAVWDGSETPEELVARADAALYEAKAAGRNRVMV